MKKSFVLIPMILFICGTALAAYPEKNIHGVVMWGAGGALDNVSRAVAPIASSVLGKSIIIQNKTGATGAIAAASVANSPADGYTILFGAENPNLYKVTGLSKIDYNDFDPVILLMANVGVVIVPKDSPYKTFNDLVGAVRRGDTINKCQ